MSIRKRDNCRMGLKRFHEFNPDPVTCFENIK
jgi:hypothetical protein